MADRGYAASLWWTAAAALSLPALVWAQAPPAASTSEVKRVPAVRIAEPMAIDGRLNEPAWDLGRARHGLRPAGTG